MSVSLKQREILTLREIIFQLLFNQGSPLREKDIFKRLNIEGKSLKEQLIKAFIDDSRFLECSRNHWYVVPLQQLGDNLPLEDVSFVITDIETTGPSKGNDRMIDLAAIKYKGGKIIDQFETLLNPQIRIPSMITYLTGIKPSMVENSPLVEEELPNFLNFLDGNIFVAHNLTFDYFFIAHEAYRLGFAMPKCLSLCTLRIARKLLPHVKSKGLNGLADHYQYEIEGRHRAMSDVLATRHFFEIFLQKLKRQEINTLHQLIGYQRANPVKQRRKKHVKKK